MNQCFNCDSEETAHSIFLCSKCYMKLWDYRHLKENLKKL